MRNNFVISKYILFSFLMVFGLALTASNISAKASNGLATSALIITDVGQFAECMVSNVTNNTVSVDIQLVALGSSINFPDVEVQANRTSIVDASLPPGTEFFCKFQPAGNSSRIRAAARLIDSSSGSSVSIQRAEAR